MEKHYENTVITIENMSEIYCSDSCTGYRYEDELGDCVVSQHSVFPGIYFIYKEFHRRDGVLRLQMPTRNMLVIEHCHEGRIECRIGGDYFYLEPGDVAIRRSDGLIRDVEFPTGHYHGIDIMIDMEKATNSFCHILKDVGVDAGKLAEKFHLEGNSVCFFRQDSHMKDIFAVLYSVPNTVKPGYLKVKLLELLLFLTGTELEEIRPGARRLSLGQMRLAREVHRYMAEHLMEQQTIEQLSQVFNVSPTRLKDSFRRAYGISIHAFVSEQRMRSAAELLRRTDRKVADIAGEFGYANASKFAAVFQRVMGETPTQYRAKQGNNRT